MKPNVFFDLLSPERCRQDRASEENVSVAASSSFE
jgi:hypothetical protein